MGLTLAERKAVTETCDTAVIPFHRVINHPDTAVDLIAVLAIAHGRIMRQRNVPREHLDMRQHAPTCG